MLLARKLQHIFHPHRDLRLFQQLIRPELRHLRITRVRSVVLRMPWVTVRWMSSIVPPHSQSSSQQVRVAKRLHARRPCPVALGAVGFENRRPARWAYEASASSPAIPFKSAPTSFALISAFASSNRLDL